MQLTQPTTYVISHASSRVIADCTTSLTRYGWPYQVVAAVDGSAVTAATWQSIGVVMNTEGKMSRRPGAQGCWISHWRLWNLCVEQDQPIVIMEHDAVVQAPWPADIDITTRLVKLYTTAECKTNPAFGRWSKGAHAYALTPTQAAQLIAHARTHGAQAVDKHLGDQVLAWRFYSQDLVTLNPKRGPSSTSPLAR